MPPNPQEKHSGSAALQNIHEVSNAFLIQMNQTGQISVGFVDPIRLGIDNWQGLYGGHGIIWYQINRLMNSLRDLLMSNLMDGYSANQFHVQSIEESKLRQLPRSRICNCQSNNGPTYILDDGRVQFISNSWLSKGTSHWIKQHL